MKPALVMVVTEKDGKVTSASALLDYPDAEKLRDTLNATGAGPARVVEAEEGRAIRARFGLTKREERFS